MHRQSAMSQNCVREPDAAVAAWISGPGLSGTKNACPAAIANTLSYVQLRRISFDLSGARFYSRVDNRACWSAEVLFLIQIKDSR